jgi:hypothetical protein
MVELAPASGGRSVKAFAPWVVFRHGAHNILGSIGHPGIGLSAPVEINQLLLSSADSPVRWIVISLIVVNGGSNIEHIKLGGIERNIRFLVLVDVMVRIS